MFKCRNRGNISIIFISLGIWLLILILFITAILYAQINTIVYNIKSDLSYVLENSLGKASLDNLSYGEYTFDSSHSKEHIEKLLRYNYIVNNDTDETNKKSNIKEIEVIDVQMIKEENQSVHHTNGLIDENIIQVKVRVAFNPMIKIFTNNQTEVVIHEDVKVSLLKFK